MGFHSNFFDLEAKVAVGIVVGSFIGAMGFLTFNGIKEMLEDNKHSKIVLLTDPKNSSYDPTSKSYKSMLLAIAGMDYRAMNPPRSNSEIGGEINFKENLDGQIINLGEKRYRLVYIDNKTEN